MATWSSRRKLTYGSIVVGAIILIVGLPAFLLFYKAPSCNDGKQNQGEGGIDCGGPCVKLCPSAYLPPEVIWTKFEPVAPGLYNIAAYVINNNLDGAAYGVPYEMQLFDAQGVLIVYKSGTMTIPPHRNTLAFQGSVSTGKRIPAKATFSFSGNPQWNRETDRLGNLSIKDKKYSEDHTSSSLQVTLGDNGVTPYSNVAVYAVLSDANGNAIDFSKTVVDSVAPSGTAVAPFTWGVSHNGAMASIEVLPVLGPAY